MRLKKFNWALAVAAFAMASMQMNQMCENMSRQMDQKEMPELCRTMGTKTGMARQMTMKNDGMNVQMREMVGGM